MRQVKELRITIAQQERLLSEEKKRSRRSIIRSRLKASKQCLNELMFPKPKEL